MALTESSARRADDGTGKNIKTFLDGDGDHLQAIVIADDSGDQTGITGNELQVDVVTSGLPSGAATATAQASLLTELQLKADLTETQPVSSTVLSVVGGGAEATAQRVTVANDSTGVLSVDDNAGSLTVDNAALSVVGGGVEATALRVTLASDSTGILTVVDGGNSLTVDNAALSVVGGGVEATALRVTLASDSTGTLTVDDGGSTLSVDDAGSSLTIDNATLSTTGGGVEAAALRVTMASDSTGILSVDDNNGSLTVDNAALSVVGGGAESTALRVTVANNSTGVLTVDDGGSSLTVDGTITIQEPLSVDDNGSSLTIDNAALSIVGGGTETAALRVTVATDSTGILTVDDGGSSLTVDNAALSQTGGGAEANVLRVTIANNSTGVLSVDDNGNSLTVDNNGTFVVQATLQTSDIIAGRFKLTDGTDVALIDGSGRLQVDIAEQSDASDLRVALPSGAATAANQQAAATTVAIYNQTMTTSDTEYSQALPSGTKRFSLQCQGNYDVRFAFATGKVATPTAPYGTVRAGMNYYEGNLSLTGITMYVACGDASQVAEIIAWS